MNNIGFHQDFTTDKIWTPETANYVIKMSANKVLVFELWKFFSINLMFPSDEQQNPFIAEYVKEINYIS